MEQKLPLKKMPSKFWSTFHRAEGHQPGGEGVAAVDVLKGPLSLQTDDGHSLDRVQKEILLTLVFYQSVDQQRISLGVDILHCDLKTIETSRFRNLNFRAKLLSQVFVYDSIGSREKS